MLGQPPPAVLPPGKISYTCRIAPHIIINYKQSSACRDACSGSAAGAAPVLGICSSEQIVLSLRVLAVEMHGYGFRYFTL